MTSRIVASRGTLRPLMWLALPVFVEQLLSAFVGLVDTWLTGHFLSTDHHLAAIGLMAYVLWLLPSMFAAVAIGATALTARFVGRGDIRLAGRVANQAVLIGCCFALVVVALFSAFDQWFVSVMQLRGEAAALAIDYLRYQLPIVPAIMLQQVGIACLRGAGDTVSGFVVMTIVNLINVVLSAGLVTGVGPFPNWGWEGLAFGTATGHLVGGSLVLLLLVGGRAGLRLRFDQMWPDGDLIRRLLRVGIPGGVDVATVLTCHLVFLSIINALGTAAAAAHSLGVRIEALAYLPGSAFQVAAATLTGQFLGAGDHHRAVRGALMACAVGVGVMGATGVFLYVGSEWLTFFFTGQSGPTADLASRLLRIVAFAMPSFALTMVLTGALRGAGDTRWPFLFTLIGFMGIRIPLALFLARAVVHLPLLDYPIQGFDLGVRGAWLAMLTDVVIRSVLLGWRFLHRGWIGTRV